MAEAEKQLTADDWEMKCDCLNAIRRLAVHHGDVLSTQLHPITVAVVAEARNLRSVVSRLAMTCLADMFTHLNGNMDTDLELTVGVLLGKTGDSNKFIREDAYVSLDAMVNSVSAARALTALIACGVGHRSAQVRVATAHHVLAVVEIIGPDRVLYEFPDKVLPAAARFVLDGSPEARYSGSCILYTLMTSYPDEFDNVISRHVSPKDLRNIQDKITRLKHKGLGSPPAGVKRNNVSQPK